MLLMLNVPINPLGDGGVLRHPVGAVPRGVDGMAFHDFERNKRQP